MTAAQAILTTWPPPDFWSNRFRAETADTKCPALFKQLVPADGMNPADVLAGLHRLRRAAVMNEPTDAHARVYIGEQRRDDLVDAVLHSPWDSTEDFVPWMQRLSGADRFGLVINNLETTSPAAAVALGQLIQSVFTGWGVPIGGCEQIAFAGNYAGTAFGIHEGYEDAFLVHLGPGVKHFYCWSGERYGELTGSDQPTFGDYTWLLEHGQLFDLEPGDVLFLPRRVFHIGLQDEFSVSVAVALYTYPDTRLLARAILPDVLERAAQDSAPSSMHPLDGGPSAVSAALAMTAADLLDDTKALLSQHTAVHIERRWQTVLSNGGWEPVEHDASRSDNAAAAAAALEAGAMRMRVPSPYRLYATDGIDDSLGIQVIVRGSALTIPESPAWGQALTALAAGKAVSITDQLHGPALQQLLDTGGIEMLHDLEER